MRGGRAVVIGGSVAGLSAARTLSDRFDSVVVLERDELAEDTQPRRGVPQGGHGHILLVAGQRALSELFPGLLAELVESGAAEFDPGTGLSFHLFGQIWTPVPTDLRIVTASRPLLELAIRRRVRALPNVELRTGATVSALVNADERVTGVRLADDTVLDADLVVDCSGRGGRSQHWLAELGYPVPRVSEIKTGVGYASRMYRRGPDDLAGARAAFALPDPPATRSGLALPVEGDRWLVSLSGWHDDFPRDEAAFKAHAAALPHPGIASIVAGCEALTDVAVCTIPVSRQRHFEELRRVPVGYLTLGDAICSFNPIYGQGMTCAALEAVELGKLLDGHDAVTVALSTDYYRRAARIVATPWQFASGGDFAYPQTEGVRPRGLALINAYTRRAQLAAMDDPDIRRVFTSVQHLVTEPTALSRPATMLKVLRVARRANRRLATGDQVAAAVSEG